MTGQSRRQLLKGCLVLVGLGPVLVTGCGLVPAVAGRPGLPRIGYLGGSASNSSTRELLAGMRDLGYVEGQTVQIDWRFDEGRPERLPELAAELVQMKPDVIVASASTPPAVAAKQATSTIPIVFSGVSDPIGSGLIASFAHPGGNATGTSNISAEVGAKRLQMVKEMLPFATRVDYMLNGANPAAGPEWEGVQAPARQLGLTLRQWDGRDVDHVEQAFNAMAGARPDAIILIVDAATYPHRQRIVELAANIGAPLIANHRDFVQLGGLLMYGPDLAENWRLAATYVDKILKGAKPAELPVERPTRFDIIVSLKAAQTLGLTLPQSVLDQATEVIQ
jgi:putative tryptophan/tyrosine transport system substrate-binding protein